MTQLPAAALRAAADHVDVLRQPAPPDQPLERIAELIERTITAPPDAAPHIQAAHTDMPMCTVAHSFADATTYNPLQGPPRAAHIAAHGGFGRPGSFRQLRDADDSPHSVSSGTRQYQPQHYERTSGTVDKPRMRDIADAVRWQPSTNAVDFQQGRVPCACAAAVRNIRPGTIAAAAMSARWIEYMKQQLEQLQLIVPPEPATAARVCACARIGPDFFLQFSNWISGHTQPVRIVAPQRSEEQLIQSICDGFIVKIIAETKRKSQELVRTVFAAQVGAKRFMVDKPLDARDQGGTMMKEMPLTRSVSYIPINGESNIARRMIGTPLADMRRRAQEIMGKRVVLPETAFGRSDFVDATVRDHLPRDESKPAIDDEWRDRIVQCTTTAARARDRVGIPPDWKGLHVVQPPTRVVEGTASDGMFIASNKDSHPRVTKFNSWTEPEAVTTARRRRMGSAISTDKYDTSFLDP